MVQYRTIDVKGHPRKSHPRKLKNGIIITVKKSKVKPFKRKLPPKMTKSDFKKLVEASELKEIEKIQVKEKDWAHLSTKYPNIIGITDEDIEDFIKQECNDLPKTNAWDSSLIGYLYNDPLIYSMLPEEMGDSWISFDHFSEYIQKKYPNPYHLRIELRRKELENYLIKIKCYNKEDLEKVSIKAFDELSTQIKKSVEDPAPSLYYHTIYLTSPRGGLESLGTFAYANNINKESIPFDLDKKVNLATYKEDLFATSLPYGYTKEVRDIVYVDDICMSGEQQTKAFDTIQKTIESLKLDPKIRPRLHYIALVGSDKVIQDVSGKRTVVPEGYPKKDWATVTIGELHNFDRNKKYDFDDVSAVVFPFTIPDGERHMIARRLYKSIDRYRHL